MTAWRRLLVVTLVMTLMIPAFPVLPLTTTTEAAGPASISDNALHKFDFGTRSSPLMQGWTRVQGGLLYSRGAGYGWDVAHQDFQNIRQPSEISPHVIQRSWVIDRYRDDMTVDGVRDEGPMTFSVDLPNGDYRVRATVGDLFYPVYSMNITAEGAQVAGELAAFHLVHRSVYMKDARDNWANYGMPLPYWFSVTVSDGVLDLVFDGTDDLLWDRMDVENATSPPDSYLTAMSTGGVKPGGVNPPYRFIGGPHTYNSVMGIEIFPPRHDLVRIGPSGLVLDGAITNTSVVNAVTAYNLASTQDEYEGVATTVEGLLTDHRTGGYADCRALEELMAHLNGNLDADLDPAQLDARIDGLATLLSREPRDQTLWELLNQTERLRTSLDFIFERVETGKNHFFENSKAATILWSFQPGDVLYHTAEMWRARALYMLDPHRWTSASGTAADVMEALRQVDPDNPYITMYRDTVPGGGRIWKEGQRVVTTTGEVDHWTQADVNAGWEGAPQWARWLREELYWLYNITDWWVLNRQQPDGALGGGWSDDVEFIGLFGFDALISQGADELSLVGARDFVEGMLASGGVDMDRGYSAAMADAEHTAEWTGDSLPMMIAVDFGNPKWVEFSYKTGVLMRDLWTGETGLGHLHFKSNYLSATRIGGTDTQEDAYINYRAALPAQWVGWYNGDPEIAELFIDWATAWVKDAMRTDDGKPRGVFPASVGFANDELGGHNSPNWYTARHPAGTVNYDWQPQMYRDYLEDVVRGAYEATGNLSLLEPFKLEAQLAQAYLDDPVPDPTPGSAAWAGMVLGGNAISRWDGMRIDYGIDGGGGMSGEPNGYTTDAVKGMVRAGRRYIDMCLPLMTTEASATDRVAFVGIINPFMIYTGGGVGGALLAPKVTYTGLGRDFAACVLDARPTGVKVQMYGFFQGTRDAGLVLWELENNGVFRATSGDDTDGDGVIDVVDDQVTFTYVAKGQEVPLKLVGGEEKLVVVEQLEEGADERVLLPDLALASDEVSANSTTGTLDVVVHNIGANASTDYYVIISDPLIRSDNIIGKTLRVPSLDPPQGMLPSTQVVQVRLSQLPSSDEVTVKVGRMDAGREITMVNNLVRARVNASLLAMNGAPVYIGPDPPERLEVEEDPNLTEPMSLLDLTLLFEDPDVDDAMRYCLTLDPGLGDEVEIVVQNGSVRLVSILTDWYGNVTFNVTAFDDGCDGIAANADDLWVTSPDFTLSVLPVNDPPEFIGRWDYLWVFYEDEVQTEPGLMVDDLPSLFYDVDGDELEYHIEYNYSSDSVRIEIVGNSVFLVWMEEDFYGWGVVSFRFNASDAGEDGVRGNEDDLHGTSEDYFSLDVHPVNDPPLPVWEHNDIEVMHGDRFHLDLMTLFEDVEGDALFFTWDVDTPEVLSFEEVSDPGEGIHALYISVTDPYWSGAVGLNITCYDRDPVGSSEPPGVATLGIPVLVHVHPPPPDLPPTAPTIEGPLEMTEGDVVEFTAIGATDPEGTTLKYMWLIDGEGISNWSFGNGLTVTSLGLGGHNLTVVVRDGTGLTNSTSITIYVAEAREDPGPVPDLGISSASLVIGIVMAVVVGGAAYYVYGRQEDR